MIISIKSYVQALFEVGQAQDNVMHFYDALLSFQDLMKDETVHRLMTLTLVDDGQIEPLWDSLTTYYPKSFVNFLRIMHDANLLKEISRIVTEYKDHLEIAGYVSNVEVVSAVLLDAFDIEQLTAMLKKKYRNHLEIHYAVDASLIDGMIVRVGHDIYDTSVKSKLHRILSQGGLEL